MAAQAFFQTDGGPLLARPPFVLPWLETIAADRSDDASAAAEFLRKNFAMPWAATRLQPTYGAPCMEMWLDIDNVFMLTGTRGADGTLYLPVPWQAYAAPAWVEWPVPIATAAQLSALRTMPAGEQRTVAFVWVPEDGCPRMHRKHVDRRLVHGWPYVRECVVVFRRGAHGGLDYMSVSAGLAVRGTWLGRSTVHAAFRGVSLSWAGSSPA